MKNNNIHTEHRILTPAADETLRKKQMIVIILDRSGSMTTKRQEVFNAVHQLLDTLHKENETNVEVCYTVRLATFNDKITECTDNAALPPELVAEMFGEEEYVTSGSTGLAAVYDYLNRNFSRHGDSFMSELQSGDPMPVVILPTDMEETDTADTIDAAHAKLMDNRFFCASKRIVIYVGNSTSKKKAAADLAGGEQHVICVNSNLSNLKEYLAPVLITTTLIHSDSTHISNVNTTPEETGKAIVEKTEAGKQSGNHFRDKNLEKELEAFLSGQNTMTDEELEKAMEQYLPG